MGFGRDLAVEEILGQVMALARAHEWPANVVFMGMGEPLLNLEAVLPALEALADERRFGLGARRITVSTAGVPPGIRSLASHPVRPNLALSLNSPFEEQRRELMPITERHPLEAVLDACKDYSERTGRRLLIEYVLLRAVNTSARAARATARIARDLGALVNLIALNPVPGCPFRPPTGEEIERFRGILEGEGVPVTQRYRRGRDIAAGCGQLGGGG
jgi:23S rRNA (adenine2503-C2)-methyltransferase